MYDLKELEDEVQSNDDFENSHANRLGDRSYYSGRLTDNILSTKTSYIPTDSLF